MLARLTAKCGCYATLTLLVVAISARSHSTYGAEKPTPDCPDAIDGYEIRADFNGDTVLDGLHIRFIYIVSGTGNTTVRTPRGEKSCWLMSSERGSNWEYYENLNPMADLTRNLGRDRREVYAGDFYTVSGEKRADVLTIIRETGENALWVSQPSGLEFRVKKSPPEEGQEESGISHKSINPNPVPSEGLALFTIGKFDDNDFHDLLAVWPKTGRNRMYFSTGKIFEEVICPLNPKSINDAFKLVTPDPNSGSRQVLLASGRWPGDEVRKFPSKGRCFQSHKEVEPYCKDMKTSSCPSS